MSLSQFTAIISLKYVSHAFVKVSANRSTEYAIEYVLQMSKTDRRGKYKDNGERVAVNSPRSNKPDAKDEEQAEERNVMQRTQ